MQGKGNVIIRVIAFYLLTLGLTIFLGGFQQAQGWYTEGLILAQFAPALAAMLLIILNKRRKIKQFLVHRAGKPRRKSLRCFTYAFWLPVGIIGITVLVLLLFSLYSGPERGFSWGILLTVLFIALGAFGEEMGWRAYLQPQAEKLLPPIKATPIVALLWAAWHVSVYSRELGFIVLFFLFIFFLSIIIRFVIMFSGFNVWAATVFHAVLNILWFFFLPVRLSITAQGVLTLVAGVFALFLLFLAARAEFIARTTG
ncbi:MAG: type II CAAX prenyl endopeptidase Rce1 family protein [Spirochaetia bacterium]